MRRLVWCFVVLLSQLMAAQQPSTSVACEFETTPTEKKGAPAAKRDWYLWRTATQVEVRQNGATDSELWTRENGRGVFYSLIFHLDQKIVDFTPGDLDALGKEVPWEKLTAIIDISQLESQLVKTGERKRVLGFEAVRYRGRINGDMVDLWWIPKLGVPAWLTVRSNSRTVRTRLKAAYVPGESAFGRADVSGYEHIDFADLGDKESDPFVRKIEGNLHLRR